MVLLYKSIHTKYTTNVMLMQFKYSNNIFTYLLYRYTLNKYAFYLYL